MGFRRYQERRTLPCGTHRSILLTAITFSLISFSSTALAYECEYARNEFDLFTKQRLVATKWDSFTDGVPSASVAVIIEGEHSFLAINLRLTKTLGYEPNDTELREFLFIPEGAKLLVRMGDGSIVELQAHKGVRADSRSTEAHTKSYEGAPYKIRYAIHSSGKIRYLLDADKITALTAQGATHVRLSTIDNDIDLNVHKRPFGNLRRAINCIQPDQIPAPS